MDFLETQTFYELMQSYRHTPISNQEKVIERFEKIKQYIRKEINDCNK